MKTDLQIAQELKEDIRQAKKGIINDESSSLLMSSFKETAKSNLEGLGCGKDTYGPDEFGWIHCGFKWGKWINKEWVLTGEIEFCHECLANGVDKAKAIYEEILK